MSSGILNEFAFVFRGQTRLTCRRTRNETKMMWSRKTYVASRNETILAVVHITSASRIRVSCLFHVSQKSQKGLHLDPREPIYPRYASLRVLDYVDFRGKHPPCQQAPFVSFRCTTHERLQRLVFILLYKRISEGCTHVVSFLNVWSCLRDIQRAGGIEY